jgi:uncharacterized protein YbaP (TraB family)
MERTSLIALLVISLGAIVAAGQAKPTSDFPSILYKITGKDLAKPSYLFGTFHVVCPADLVPASTLEPYIAETDQLIMEINLSDPSELRAISDTFNMPAGKSLSDFLTTEQLAKVDAMVATYLGQPPDVSHSRKPVVLMMMVVASAKSMGCSPDSYEFSLLMTAAARKKPILGLETVAEQMRLLDSKPLKEQAKELYEMSLDPQKWIQQLKELSSAYRLRDSERLFQYSAEQMKEQKDYAKQLLDDRNVAWVPKIENALRVRSAFIAVGAGHLGGEKGLVRLLRAKGYQVTPVKL